VSERAAHRFDVASGLTLQHVLVQRAQREPERAFCRFDTRWHSYGELEAGISGYARRLRDSGVLPGDRVVVLMANRLEYFFAMLGVQRAASVYVPCSTGSPADEVRHVLEHSDATLVLTDGSNRELAAAAAAAASLQARVVDVDSEPGWGAADQAGESFPVEAASQRLAMIMYTSGTTARPKGVMFTHANLLHAAVNIARAFDWSPEERLLHYFPLHHSNGGLVQMGPTLLRGSALVMVPRFTASGFGRLLAENSITFAAVNATHVKLILARPPTEFDAAHRCRRMLFGLSLEPRLLAEFEARFHTRLVPTYGLTESIGICAACSLDFDVTERSAGRPLPGYQLALADEQGGELSAGETGEILVRAVTPHGLSAGYWRDAEATEALFAGGWLHTGDIGRFDELGCLHFIERKKDMIKRAGFNVAPAEVERALLDDPRVRDASVVGVPEALREEAIVAFVVGDPVPEAALLEQCRRRLADSKVPQAVFRLDELPRDVLGKVDRKRLRQEAARLMLDREPTP
jgi:carnitine-CoA ligase